MSRVDFPLTIDQTGRTGVVGRAQYVRGLIEQVLFTAPGERVHRPTFGSGLHHLVFEPGGDQVAAALLVVIQGAMTQWLAEEIEIRDVTAASSEGHLDITVKYSLTPDPAIITETFSKVAS